MAKFVKVVWDYQANEDNELTMNVGDIIEVLTEDPSGWWTGKVSATGAQGTFPENFTEPYVPPTTKRSAPPPPPRAGRPTLDDAPPAAADPPGPTRASPLGVGGGGGSDPMAELKAKLARRTMVPTSDSSSSAPAESSGGGGGLPAPQRPVRGTRATIAPGGAAPVAKEEAQPAIGPGLLRKTGGRPGGSVRGPSVSPSPAARNQNLSASGNVPAAAPRIARTDIVKSADSVHEPPVDDDPRPKCRGVHDYAAEGETELDFKEGDIIIVVEKDESGWWQGELNGQLGWFPATFVEDYVPEPKGPSIADRIAEATATTQRLESPKRIARTGRRPPSRGKKAGSAVKSCREQTGDAPADLSGRTTVIGVSANLAAELKAAGAKRSASPGAGPTIPVSEPSNDASSSPFPKLGKPTRAQRPVTMAPTTSADEAPPVDFRAGLKKVDKQKIAPAIAANVPEASPAPTPAAQKPAGRKLPKAAPAPAPAPAAAAAAAELAPIPATAAPGPNRSPAPIKAKKQVGAAAAAKPAVKSPMQPSLPQKLGQYAEFRKAIKAIFEEVSKSAPTGSASRSPFFSSQTSNSNDFSVSICTVDGVCVSFGPSIRFTLQEAIFPFLFAKLVNQLGANKAFKLIGMQKVSSNAPSNGPYNPMTTAGAMIALNSLYNQSNCTQASNSLMDDIASFSGKRVGCDFGAYFALKSEAADTNAQAYMLQSSSKLSNAADTLSLYFQATSTLVSCEEAASMTASLANSGNLPNGVSTISAEAANAAVKAMQDFSQGTGSNSIKSGGQAGESGCVIAVIPTICSIVAYSPSLSSDGLSVKAVQFINSVCNKFNL